ncbi:DMT family transporter [Roseisolibacter sp. H3M3-2]|uniref:DMT family transporter n=1 Tax=Roseisolibacter sp. H3M3-2 TaxID=3031323 RepID=UPI0023DAFFCA|nr:DMT family transporter [Roseisolibacter sp. H3M3-2]MDF1502930.1 DMT family transporter [Roseisolibacter sp. H3M3-2]
MSRPSAARASLLVAFAACCFGSISILTVVATRAGTALTTLLFWRYAVAALLLLPVGLRSLPRVADPRTVPRGAGLARELAVAGAGQAAVAFLSLSALRWIPAATLGFLFYTFPAWVALFAALRGTERVDGRKVVALGLSLAGIVCTVGAPSGATGTQWPGVLLALAGALVYAVYIPYLGGLQGRATPQLASLLVTTGAATAFALGALAEGTFTARLPLASWGAVAGLAVLCTAIAFQAFMKGLGGLGPVRAAIVSTVEPFWTAVLGALVLSQPLTPATLLGGALIAAAVLLLQLPTRGAERGPAVERAG